MSSDQASEFSLVDPAISSEPWGFYKLLQEEDSVYQMPETGAFVITRYDDLRQVLRDPETFSSDVRAATIGQFADLQQSILKEGGGWEHVQTLQRTDPPVHSRYRKLLDRVFTIKRVRALLPHIEDVVNELIDDFIDQGECEFNNDFAMQMPGIIVAEQLGLDRDNVATFKKWGDAMLGSGRSPIATEEEVRANAEIELEAQLFLAEVFEERRAHPTDDLMSAMVHAHGDDEEPLSMHELQNLMHQLITGGFETTQSAINHGLWALIRFPELQERLRSDEKLMKPFVDEVLRWESPVQFLARRATHDVELGGTTIPKDSMVLVGYGPANRDESKFECPHQFNVERGNAGAHLAFGSGAHFCVGALLAKQELTSSFNAIVQRMDDIELAQPLPDPVHSFTLFFLPMHDFHVKFKKR
ncbi:MAG: cytochrome P450 [Gammaproteobacteria bacterium]|jgi:cytochrome P450|nr:cytochrome P450 [Gammaproteobacteria bacterium]